MEDGWIGRKCDGDGGHTSVTMGHIIGTKGP